MVTMTDELADTKATPPRHVYRSVKLKRGRAQKVRMFVVAPRSAKTPQTASVTKTQEGTLKGSGRIQASPPTQKRSGGRPSPRRRPC